MPVITCANCGAPLTSRLRKGNPSELRRRVGAHEPTIRRGLVVVDERPVTVEVWYPKENRRETVEQAPAGSYVVNPDDRLPDALAVVPGRGAGCCGLDGQDGPNQQCGCGTVVGTAWTDCWTKYETRFLPDHTVLR